MTGIKRWRRVVFDAELDCSGSCLAGNLGSNSKPKIDAGSDTTRGDHVAVSNDPGLLVGRPDKRSFSAQETPRSVITYRFAQG